MSTKKLYKGIKGCWIDKAAFVTQRMQYYDMRKLKTRKLSRIGRHAAP